MSLRVSGDATCIHLFPLKEQKAGDTAHNNMEIGFQRRSEKWLGSMTMTFLILFTKINIKIYILIRMRDRKIDLLVCMAPVSLWRFFTSLIEPLTNSQTCEKYN